VSASFDLALDTRAPVVTWGAVGGATAGELLEVLYSSDEPLDSAKLWLPDGRKLAMTIEVDRLTLLLPADTPDGISWIHVYDDVMNETPRQAVNIAGVIVVPPEEPPALGPGPRAREGFHPDRVETRLVRSRSRGVATSRTRTSTTTRVRSRAVADSRSMIHRSRTMKSRGVLRSTTRTSTAISYGEGVVQRHRPTIVRRHDGPDETDALFVLGLL
jgi:hypothetical protein